MTEREFINQLFTEKSTYNYQSQAVDLANSLDTLSDDIYSESERFIYELIQNADDACDDFKKGVEVFFEFTQNFIIISHTGKPFSKDDIRGISGIGTSQKKNNPNQTGYKGIGFKSVFGKSNYVCIKSNNFCFRFDKEYWSGKKMPWQIIPIWTENIYTELKESFSVNYPVSTAIKCSNINKLKEVLLELLNNTQILLFLRNVKKITVNGSTKLVIEKIKSSNSNTVIINKNGSRLNEWIVKEFKISISKEIQQFIKKDDKSPPKLQEAQFTNISLAAQIEGGTLVQIKNNALVFTYLPTKINLGFPFLVNGDFLTNASREGFHEDRFWNKWLFKQVAINLLEWLAELAKNEFFKYQITNLVPERFYTSNQIKLSFNEGLNEGLSKIAFIPSQNNTLLKIHEALIDQTGIHKIIGSKAIIEYYNYKNILRKIPGQIPLVDCLILTPNKLLNLGMKEFTIKDLKDFFNSEIFQKYINIKNNYELIKFLFDKYTDAKYADKNQKNPWREIIKHLPFILSQNEELTAPEAPIYFPNPNFDTALDELNDCFIFIHETILQQIFCNPTVCRWFKQDLHITEPTQQNIIEKTIIPKIKELSDTGEKSLKLVKYLFNAYEKRQLLEEHFNKLSEINLLTNAGTLSSPINTFLYLSDAYKPELPLEKIFVSMPFISENYIDENDNIKIWNLFLTKIGVLDTIKIINFNNSYDYSNLIQIPLFLDYLKYILSQEFIPSNYFNFPNQDKLENFVTATFIEFTTDYNYAKVFWYSFIKSGQKWKEHKTKYWFRNRAFDVPTYFEYFILSRACIPTQTGKCYKANEVIINRQEFKKIGGDFLPILDLDCELPREIEDFLPFKTELTLEDYLHVLTHISECSYEEGEIARLTNRLLLIYEALSKFDRPSEIEQIREWGENNEILAKDYSFYPPRELYYVAINNFEAPANINNFVSLPEGNKKIIELLKLWNIKIIESENFTLKKSGQLIETYELKNRLKSHLPLITLVAIFKYNTEWETQFQRLAEILEKSTFYKAESLCLTFEQNGQVFIQQICQAACKDADFYYTGNWHSPKTLYSLIEKLCKFLEIPLLEKELIVLILESFESALEWLKEQGYDINKIPEEYKYLVQDQSISIVSSNYPRTTSQEERDKETGKIGEKFVYQELKRIFLEKYGALENDIQVTEKGFKLKAVEVIWENQTCESLLSYDFKVIEKQKRIEKTKLSTYEQISYIDAKSTTTSESDGGSIPFYLSPQEWALMLSEANCYYIARVFETRSNNRYIKFIKLEEGKL